MISAAPAIKSTTRLFAVIGDPIHQVQAPALLNPFFASLGVDATLVPVHARQKHFADVIRGLQRIDNLDGLLITIPHKISACRFADELSPAVAIAGSANALRRNADGRWFADNFDGVGFVKGLTDAGHAPLGKRVSLVGAGGAGSAIAVALLDTGIAHLSICDQDADRLRELLSRLQARWPGKVVGVMTPELDAIDIAVNATPLGLRPDDPLPFEPAAMRPRSVVADIIMKPRDTSLLKAATTLGHHPHHGILMLSHQLDYYRVFFQLDRDPQTAVEQRYT